MNNYLDSLNDVQRDAVTHMEGPMLVIAGPGSGKTRVLTFRIAHLINNGVPPYQILALTFTNKAAREMKERIEQVVGSKANQVWAGTFHSIFARILRYEAETIGYPSSFTIYDSDDSKSVIHHIVKELHLDPKVYQSNAIASRISAAKANLISPKQYLQNAELVQQDVQAKRPMTAEIYKQYMARNRRSGAMDFDDLLYNLYWLFRKSPETLKKYQDKFKYLLVDEFQDTNYLQYAILKQLTSYEGSPNNICVVGDDAQSIYAFRGATIDNILNFERDYKNLATYKLEQNYRSTSHIVNAANDVIGNNTKQIVKEIWTDKGDGNKIKVLKNTSDVEEGRRVISTIIEHKNREHIDNSEIAILYRTNAQSRVFEEYLRRENIPYRVYGGLSFYQRKEVKDMVAYMRLAVNPHDDEALRRVINFPARGIGNSTLAKIAAKATELSISMWEALPHTKLSTRAANQVGIFRKLVLDIQAKEKTTKASELVDYIYIHSGLRAFYNADNSPEGQGRVENIQSLIDGVYTFVDDSAMFAIEDEEDDKSLGAYLQNITLLTDADKESDNPNVVTLMSIHAAKGLEFTAVFVTGLEENIFPSYMSSNTVEGLDEERRLFYVAITRAKEHLTLSYASSRYRFGSMKYNEQSRFLDEIDPKRLDAPTGRTGFQAEGYNSEPLSTKSTVAGLYPRKVKKKPSKLSLPNFSPSPAAEINEGQEVMHEYFGKGKVISIDGSADKRVAKIYFRDIDNPERRIMLKFAKLEILSES